MPNNWPRLFSFVNRRELHDKAACSRPSLSRRYGTAAAIGNAVFNATGRRVRDLPITLD
jgi:hypothetical protein